MPPFLCCHSYVVFVGFCVRWPTSNPVSSTMPQQLMSSSESLPLTHACVCLLACAYRKVLKRTMLLARWRLGNCRWRCVYGEGSNASSDRTRTHTHTYTDNGLNIAEKRKMSARILTHILQCELISCDMSHGSNATLVPQGETPDMRLMARKGQKD